MAIDVPPPDRIPMSQRERDVLKVMHGVLRGERTQAEAAALLRRSVRQVRRLQRKLEAGGDAALVHGLLSTVTVVAPRGRAAAPGPGTAPARGQVIVAIGDSITQCLHDTQQRGGWVGRLAGQLAHDYPATPFQLVNKGINGDTAAGVLSLSTGR